METQLNRRFLLKDESWRSQVTSTWLVEQGCLALVPGQHESWISVVGSEGWLNISVHGRGELDAQYSIPVAIDDAKKLLRTCDGKVLRFVRNIIPTDRTTWTVDEYLDDNVGLIIASAALAEGLSHTLMPDWVGEEITGARYCQSSLIRRPYSEWSGDRVTTV